VVSLATVRFPARAATEGEVLAGDGPGGAPLQPHAHELGRGGARRAMVDAPLLMAVRAYEVRDPREGDLPRQPPETRPWISATGFLPSGPPDHGRPVRRNVTQQYLSPSCCKPALNLLSASLMGIIRKILWSNTFLANEYSKCK